MKTEKVVLILFVAAVLGAGLMAGVIGFEAGSHDDWSPRNYVAADGECFVPPQGDPLYDAHYASAVNDPNCGAFKVQAEAGYIEAQTEAVRIETGQNRIGVYLMLGAVLAMLILLLFAVLKP